MITPQSCLEESAMNNPPSLVFRFKLRAAALLTPALVLICAELSLGVAADVQAPSFVLGADVSALGAPARGGWAPHRTYQENGRTNEEWAILLKHGWTMFRLRVFVSPVRNQRSS